MPAHTVQVGDTTRILINPDRPERGAEKLLLTHFAAWLNREGVATGQRSMNVDTLVEDYLTAYEIRGAN